MPAAPIARSAVSAIKHAFCGAVPQDNPPVPSDVFGAVPYMDTQPFSFSE